MTVEEKRNRICLVFVCRVKGRVNLRYYKSHGRHDNLSFAFTGWRKVQFFFLCLKIQEKWNSFHLTLQIYPLFILLDADYTLFWERLDTTTIVGYLHRNITVIFSGFESYGYDFYNNYVIVKCVVLLIEKARKWENVDYGEQNNPWKIFIA